MMVDKDKQGYRIDLDLAFRALEVSMTQLQPADYFVATQSIKITFLAENSTVISHTSSQKFETNYKNTYSRNRTTNLRLQSSSVNGTPPYPTYDSGSMSQYEVSFQGAEHTLVASSTPGRVEWTLSTPRGEKAIRDFILGNLYLYLVVGWQDLPRKGSMLVRLSDISFFNSNSRKITNPLTVIAMRYAMWLDKIELPLQNALSIEFEVKDEN